MATTRISGDLAVQGTSLTINAVPAVTTTGTQTLTNKTLTAPSISSPTGITKGDVGLGNVDNTSDSTKNSASVSLTNKTIDASLNTLSNITNTEIGASAAISLSKLAATTTSRVLVSDGSGVISASSVTTTTLGYLDATSSIQTQINSKISSSEKGANSGVATLDAGGKVPASQLPNSVMTYEGTFDASGTPATPLLNGDSAANAGMVYLANVAGSYDFGAGAITFAVGDWAVYNGSIWEKSTNSNSVTSVNSQTGVVVLNTSHISENTNLYFTDERAQDAVGAMVANSSKVSLTYVDGTPSLTADIVSGSLVNADINASAAIAYSKLNLSGSIVNADINASAAITLSKLAAVTANKALASDSSGFIVATSVTDTELGYVSGVTSAIQTQLTGKASTTLDNLGVTAINATLNPSTGNTYSLGSAGNIWANAYAGTVGGGTGKALVDFSGGVVKDSSNNTALDINNRTLKNSSGTIVLDFSGTVLDANTHKITNVVNPTSAQDVATKNYVDNAVNSVTGDLAQVSFAGAESASNSSITGFAFSNATVRSFRAQVSVYIDATSDLAEVFEIIAIQKAASWDIAYSSTGDVTSVSFTIDSSGQVQYSSSTYTGFSSMTMKIRASVTSV